MKRLAALLVVLLCAGSTADEPAKFSCWASQQRNPTFGKLLPGDYRIALGPTPGGADAENCEATITDSSGAVVFHTSGFNVVLEEEQAGLDFDGDGKPELVLRTDTAGGEHCCWTYDVISLSPKPRKLFELVADGRMHFERDARGIVIWQRVAGPSGYTSEARRPFAEKAFRFRAGKLVDVTADFSAVLFSEENSDFREAVRQLTPERLRLLRSDGGPQGGAPEEVVSALLSSALQHVFCRQFDEALVVLANWPQSTQEKMKADFAASLREDYPAFAAKLLAP